MKKIISKNLLAVALVASSVFSAGMLLGCSTAPQKESTGQYVDSSVITSKVKTKLLTDKYVKGLPITVKTYKNIVQLSGFVDSQAQEERAIEIAKSVDGVAGVHNALVIK